MADKRKNTGTDAAASEAAAPKKSKKKQWLITLGVVAVLLVGVVAGGLYWHEQPSFCSTLCHSTMAPYYESYTGGELLVALHAEEGITCLDCHEATIEDQMKELQAQVGGDFAEPLKQREFKNDFCAGEECHGDAKLKEMAELTADLEANPHDNHKSAGMKCTLCHNMHAPQETPCVECHPDNFDFAF